MAELTATFNAAARLAPSAAEPHLEAHRVELTAYCYRMLGSAFEAEDAVQETLVRAWRSIAKFEGRAALRSWLYRIATNVCLDMLAGRKRRARPVDMGPASRVADGVEPPIEPGAFVEPIPEALVVAGGVDPAAVIEVRESVRLAFVAALQHLPPRQRAVLILRDVLHWHAAEVAELLDTGVVAVNSALQRARATLAAADISPADVLEPMDGAQRALLARYVDAFERYDMASLTALLREDAIQSMPPYAMWLVGPEEIARWMLGPGIGCDGSRLLPVAANGLPAFGQYKPSPDEPGILRPWSINVIEIRDGRIAGLTWFLDTEHLFPLFGLPELVPALWLGSSVRGSARPPWMRWPQGNLPR
jgi:RNA polymerase sigma-70 factor, ECF subfamily